MILRSGDRVLIPECQVPLFIIKTLQHVMMTQVRQELVCVSHGLPLCLPSSDNIISVSEDDEAGDDRKKRPRTAFTAAQIKALESEFEKNKYLSVSKRMQLSKQLKLTETQV